MYNANLICCWILTSNIPKGPQSYFCVVRKTLVINVLARNRNHSRYQLFFFNAVNFRKLGLASSVLIDDWDLKYQIIVGVDKALVFRNWNACSCGVEKTTDILCLIEIGFLCGNPPVIPPKAGNDNFADV